MSKACDKSLIIANFDSRLVIYDKIGTANLIYMRTFFQQTSPPPKNSP